MATQNNYKIFTDGGARGNPGPGSIGAVIKTENGKLIQNISQFIGNSTNNEAEYQALIAALKYISENKEKLEISSLSQLNFYADSSLIVNQVNGLFKVKNGRLREFIFRIRQLESEIPGKIIYSLIPREKNFEADALVNQALDKQMYI